MWLEGDERTHAQPRFIYKDYKPVEYDVENNRDNPHNHCKKPNFSRHKVPLSLSLHIQAVVLDRWIVFCLMLEIVVEEEVAVDEDVVVDVVHHLGKFSLNILDMDWKWINGWHETKHPIDDAPSNAWTWYPCYRDAWKKWLSRCNQVVSIYFEISRKAFPRYIPLLLHYYLLLINLLVYNSYSFKLNPNTSSICSTLW